MYLFGIFFFFKELSALAGETINSNRECADIYPENWHGLYHGNRNVTVTGKPCKEWSETSHPYYGPANYCRSPSQDLQNGPWCYINESPWWELCFVPHCNIDCRPSSMDLKYSGTLNITRSGLTCRMWSDKSALPGGGDHPFYQNELMNFCRTPHYDPETKPWCYTSSRTLRWEHCDVPLCETITTTVCPDLKGEPHMIQPKRLTGYRYGEVVTFICEAGYTLNMNTTLKCLAQSQISILGKWNSSQPECISNIVCHRLNVGEGIIVNGLRTTIKFNEPVTLSCKKGFHGTSIQIACYHDGSWPNKRPTCTPIVCHQLIVGEGIEVNGLKTTINFNESVTLSCKEGFTGSSIQIACKPDGIWPNQRPSCTPVPCPALNKTEYIDTPIQISGYHFGNNITFQCKVGYRLSGPPSITCRSSKNKSIGQWSDQQPLCLALPCPSLKLPMHSLNKDLKESQMYYVDQNVDFKCEKGYDVIGNGTFKCTVNSNSSVVDWNYEDNQTCLEKSKSCKDYMEKRCSCMSYGLFGGTIAVFVAISAGGHIATCFYFRKREGKSATVYEDMQFKTVERQNGSNDETYTELT